MDAPLSPLKCLTDDDKLIAEIVVVLKKSGCCPRCVLRFLGEKDPAVYRFTTTEIEELVQIYYSKSTTSPSTLNSTAAQINNSDTETNGSDTAAANSVKSVCPVCLGILQGFLENHFILKIKDDVTKADFEFSSYICSLSIPVCVLLREHALLVYLTELYSNVYEGCTDSDFISVKDAWKWRMGPVLAEVIGVPFDLKSGFNISLTFSYSKTDKECSILSDFKPDVFQKRKFKKGQGERFNHTNMSKALLEIDNASFKRIYTLPPSEPEVACHCDEVRCSYESMYIAGRYNKYSRALSQTPWFLEGERKMESSVEEKICDVLQKTFRYEDLNQVRLYWSSINNSLVITTPHEQHSGTTQYLTLSSSDHRFSSSGREDVDVKMLGSGRPFVVEMINAHRVVFSPEQIASIQKEINDMTADVQVRDLQIVSREETNNLKEGEMEKTKVYTALCWCAEPLTQEVLDRLQTMNDVVLQQKTPIRVLHRRPLAVRERTVYKMSGLRQDDHHFTLDLTTQAGTYVKEFVHGDFGRTKPNLSMLTGIECDILELDVKAVELDWPKSLGNG